MKNIEEGNGKGAISKGKFWLESPIHPSTHPPIHLSSSLPNDCSNGVLLA
jgi:hypothetical protein